MQPAAARNEAAIYWTAVSLIVCEGLPIDKAAERLAIDCDELREILNRRQMLLHQTLTAPAKPSVPKDASSSH
jgi:hypothetical protein